MRDSGMQGPKQIYSRCCQAGFSLIELLVFIVVMAVIISGLSTILSSSLAKSPQLSQSLQAIYLAQERMELILGLRRAQGFSLTTAANYDPCLSNPAATVSACTSIPAGYVVNSAFVDNWGGDTNIVEISVTVSGKGDAQISTLMANY